jgi:hypothetical protein
VPKLQTPNRALRQTASSQTKTASKQGQMGAAATVPTGSHRPASASVTASGSPTEIHRRADAAMQGMGSPFPHSRRIQESFGDHSIGHLRAHVDDNARELTKQGRAKGMTKGYRTAFAKTAPSVHTAAHEAAHAKVYELAHVNLPGDVGSVGDPHERLADQIADRVVAGRTATDLLHHVARGPNSRRGKQPSRAATLQQPSPVQMNRSSAPVQMLVEEDGLRVKSSEFGHLPKNRTVREAPGGGGKILMKGKKGDIFNDTGETRMGKDGILWKKVVVKHGKNPDSDTRHAPGWIKAEGAQASVKKSFQRFTDPIIPKGHTPSPADVHQGNVGDCYLMAAMASVASKSPTKIKRMFTPAPNDTQSDNVTVRFYEIPSPSTGNTQLTASSVTVKKSIPRYVKIQGTAGSRSLEGHTSYAKVKGKTAPVYWPAMIEKAHAAWPKRKTHLGQKNTTGKSSYESLDGGHGHHALTQLTGEVHEEHKLSELNAKADQATGQNVRGTGRYSPSLSQMYEKIQANIRGKGAMTITTQRSWKGTDRENLSTGVGHSAGEKVKGGLAAQHVYSLIGTHEKKGLKYVQIRNPWGHTGQKYKKGGMFGRGPLQIHKVKGKAGAISDVELSDLPRHFSSIGAKMPKG